MTLETFNKLAKQFPERVIIDIQSVGFKIATRIDFTLKYNCPLYGLRVIEGGYIKGIAPQEFNINRLPEEVIKYLPNNYKMENIIFTNHTIYAI